MTCPRSTSGLCIVASVADPKGHQRSCSEVIRHMVRAAVAEMLPALVNGHQKPVFTAGTLKTRVFKYLGTYGDGWTAGEITHGVGETDENRVFICLRDSRRKDQTLEAPTDGKWVRTEKGRQLSEALLKESRDTSETDHKPHCAMSQAASGGGNPYSVSCTCAESETHQEFLSRLLSLVRSVRSDMLSLEPGHQTIESRLVTTKVTAGLGCIIDELYKKGA